MYNIQLGQRPILPKRALLLKKRGPKTKNFTTPHSILFLSILHKNKALHNFHKREHRPIAGRIKGLY